MPENVGWNLRWKKTISQAATISIWKERKRKFGCCWCFCCCVSMNYLKRQPKNMSTRIRIRIKRANNVLQLQSKRANFWSNHKNKLRTQRTNETGSSSSSSSITRGKQSRKRIASENWRWNDGPQQKMSSTTNNKNCRNDIGCQWSLTWAKCGIYGMQPNRKCVDDDSSSLMMMMMLVAGGIGNSIHVRI